MLTEVEEKRTRHGLIQRRCGHELRTRSSEGRGQVAKANLLVGWDSLLGVTRGKDSSSYKCVCSSNRGPPCTSDDSAIWTDHAAESKRLN